MGGRFPRKTGIEFTAEQCVTSSIEIEEESSNEVNEDDNEDRDMFPSSCGIVLWLVGLELYIFDLICNPLSRYIDEYI